MTVSSFGVTVKLETVGTLESILYLSEHWIEELFDVSTALTHILVGETLLLKLTL